MRGSSLVFFPPARGQHHTASFQIVTPTWRSLLPPTVAFHKQNSCCDYCSLTVGLIDTMNGKRKKSLGGLRKVFLPDCSENLKMSSPGLTIFHLRCLLPFSSILSYQLRKVTAPVVRNLGGQNNTSEWKLFQSPSLGWGVVAAFYRNWSSQYLPLLVFLKYVRTARILPNWFPLGATPSRRPARSAVLRMGATRNDQRQGSVIRLSPLRTGRLVQTWPQIPYEFPAQDAR